MKGHCFIIIINFERNYRDKFELYLLYYNNKRKIYLLHIIEIISSLFLHSPQILQIKNSNFVKITPLIQNIQNKIRNMHN